MQQMFSSLTAKYEAAAAVPVFYYIFCSLEHNKYRKISAVAVASYLPLSDENIFCI